MKCVYGGILAALLLSSFATPALAECVNPKCPEDAASIATARARVQNFCGCTREGQKHGKYTKCVKQTLNGADLTAIIPQKACRKLITKCESSSICGKPNAAVCCVLKKNGAGVKASIVNSSAKCKKGSACGAFLGLFSTFDACATDGTCAGPTTTTTTTLPGRSRSVLKGALASTPGRFNFNATLGLPGANAACNTNFPGTHVCTVTELQSAQAAADLNGLTDIEGKTVTSFWAIDPSAPVLQQCNDDVPGGSALNWEYATAHTQSRGEKVDLTNGALGALQTGVQCNIAGTSWVGCCQ